MEIMLAIINCVITLAVIALAVFLIVTIIKMAKSIKRIENILTDSEQKKENSVDNFN